MQVPVSPSKGADDEPVAPPEPAIEPSIAPSVALDALNRKDTSQLEDAGLEKSILLNMQFLYIYRYL